jgi:hypothetical protein
MNLPNMISTPDFIKKIEEIQAKSGTDYIDAVIDYCTKNGIEVETAAAIIKSNPSIKSKIQIEAENLNVLEKTSRLPIE